MEFRPLPSRDTFSSIGSAGSDPDETIATELSVMSPSDSQVFSDEIRDPVTTEVTSRSDGQVFRDEIQDPLTKVCTIFYIPHRGRK